MTPFLPLAVLAADFLSARTAALLSLSNCERQQHREQRGERRTMNYIVHTRRMRWASTFNHTAHTVRETSLAPTALPPTGSE